MDEADRIDASLEDMTAAETAPRPSTPTGCGVRYLMTKGRMSDGGIVLFWTLKRRIQFNLMHRVVEQCGPVGRARHEADGRRRERDQGAADAGQ